MTQNKEAQMNEQNELGTLDSAIEACELNIRRHRSLAIITMIAGILLLLVVIFSAGTYATLTGESNDSQRLVLLGDVSEQLKNVFSVERNNGYYHSEIRDIESKLEDMQEEKPEGNPPDKATLATWKSATKKLEQKKNSLGEKIQKAKGSAQEKLAASRQVLQAYKAPSLIPQEMMLSLVALFVFILSISTALYRFHQKEMTKNEHYKLGFLRIRIAANNVDRKGFGSEVRNSLTSDAFTFHPESLFDKKNRKIESPIPGHPSSDLATGIVNKLLEQVDVVLKPK